MDKRLIIFLCVVAGLYLCGVTPFLPVVGDDCHYILLARALLQGKGYTDIFFPNEPVHNLYSPGLPFMLMPIMLVAGEDVALFKLVPLLAMLGAVWVMYLLLKEYSPKAYIFPLLIFATNPLVVQRATAISSDAPFILGSFLALYFLHKYEKIPPVFNRYLWLSLLSFSLAFYSRPTGAMLLPSACLFFILKKSYKKAVVVSLLFLCAAGFWITRNTYSNNFYLQVLTAKTPLSISSEKVAFFEASQRICRNVILYAGKITADIFFFPFLIPITKLSKLFWLKASLSFGFSFVILYGFLKQLRKEVLLFHVYVIFAFVLCLLWPYQDPRYIMSVFPFLVLFLLDGIKALTKTRQRHVAAVVAGVMLLCNALGDLSVLSKNRFYPYKPEEKAYLSALDWIKEYAPSGSIVMCSNPRITFYLTDHKALANPTTLKTEIIVEAIRQSNARYVVVDALGREEARFGFLNSEKMLIPVIRHNPELFILRFTSPEPRTYVYEVNRQLLSK